MPSTNGFGPFLPGVFNMQHLEHFRAEQSEQPGQVSPSDECGHTNASIATIVTACSTWQHADSINEGRILYQPGCTRRRPSFCFLAGGAATSSAAGLVVGRPTLRFTIGAALGSTHFVRSFGSTSQPSGCIPGSRSHRP